MLFMFIFVLIAYGMLNYFICYQLHLYMMSYFQIPLLALALPYSLCAFSIFIPFIPVTFPGKSLLDALGTCWMGIFVYLLLYCLLGLILKRFLPIKLSGILVIILTLTTITYGFIHGSQVVLKEYDVGILNEDYTMVLISDVHLGSLGSINRLEKTVDLINKQDADIVVIAGDLFDSDFNKIKEPEKIKQLFASIQTKDGIYACMGNHDAGKTYPQMLEFASECNIHVLKDEHTTINNKFILAGRNDGQPIGQSGKRIETNQWLETVPQDLPLVVLDHTPSCIDEYDKRVSLLMCGHTHKGQLFPFGFVTNALFPCDYGYYKGDGPHCIVTSGSGLWGMPMRVGSNCEVVSIELKKE